MFHEVVEIHQRTLMFKKKILGPDWLCGGLNVPILGLGCDKNWGEFGQQLSFLATTI